MRLAGRLQLHSLGMVVLVLVLILLIDENVGWRELLAPGALAAVVALFTAGFFTRDLTRNLEGLRDVTRALATGDLTARPPLSESGEIGELSTAVLRLSEHLGSRIAALRTEDALLASLIEALDEGVVAVSSRRDIVRINSAARAILSVQTAVPFSSDSLPRVRELRTALDHALAGIRTEGVETVIGPRTVSLTARPLESGGAVLAMFDLTAIRRLEMVRRDFVANVSHELRTPLTVVSGYAETLVEEDPPVEARRQFASAIKTHTERMQRIVDDLLDLSRLESGHWEPAVTEVDFLSIASDIRGMYHDIARPKGISLEVSSPDQLPSVDADRTAIRQILSNLVDNAVRHTGRGTVTMFAESADGGVWVGVADTGPGIAPEHLPRIFERFYRVDQGRSRDSGGTGLGLAIVKHLVDAHSGKIRVESEPGKGTTIAAFFPHRG